MLSAFTLSAMPDVERALAEWRRVLTPTGTLGVAAWADLVDDAWAWEGELNDRFAHEVAAELLEVAGRLFGRFGEEAAAARRARARRLRRRHGRDKHVDLTFASAEAWWEWTWAGGFRAFLEAMPEDAQLRYREAGVRPARDRRPDAALRRASPARAVKRRHARAEHRHRDEQARGDGARAHEVTELVAADQGSGERPPAALSARGGRP